MNFQSSVLWSLLLPMGKGQFLLFIFSSTAFWIASSIWDECSFIHQGHKKEVVQSWNSPVFSSMLFDKWEVNALTHNKTEEWTLMLPT